MTIRFPGLPTAEQEEAILAANRAANATRACPACGAAPGVDCEPECALYQLCREREECDECNGDVRLCGCFWKYAPEAETKPGPARKDRVDAQEGEW